MRPQIDTYQAFETDDFLLDDFFISSMKHPDAATEKFWQDFEQAHPSQSEKLSEARKLVTVLSFTKDIPAAGAKENLWNKIVAESKNEPAKVVPIKSSVIKKWMAVAASVAVISVASWMAFFRGGTEKETIQTAYGEKKELLLPDNSTIVLNANSSLQYSKEWNNEKPREIWVNGEAYLKVTHTNIPNTKVIPHDRFIVHLSNINVEVLGTTFTVKDRRNEATIVLETGSVKVTVPQQESDTLTMKPGERVTYKNGTKQLNKTIVDAASTIAWISNKLVFDNTPMKDVVDMIEDNYGLKTEMSDELLQRSISGTCGSANDTTILKSLEIILNATIIRKGKNIEIKAK